MRLFRLLKNDIVNEASEWVRENIISTMQAEQICQKYGIDYHKAKNRSLGYNVLVGLGYLFIGLSVITLLGANWDDIPRAVRMWGLIGLTMATQGFALKIYMSGDSNKASGIFLLGNILYGASIILIAQVYHLGEHMPDGIYWWALGCLPIGILIKSSIVTLQAALLALLWFLMETNMGFYPVSFPIFILGSLLVLYRGGQSVMLFLAVVASTGFWVEYTLAEYWREGRLFIFHAEHVTVSISMFIMAYVTSHWLSRKDSAIAKDYGALLAVWSLRFGLIFMLVMSFKEPWDELINANWENITSMIVFVVIFSVATLALAYNNKRLVPVIYIIPFFVLTLVVLLLSGNAEHAVYYQVVYNIVLVAVGVWLIIRGIHGGISHYFFLGVTTILLTAFMRYIDLIGDYIGGATLFMVFAILMLGAAKYWKQYQIRGNA
jgi:uncharacterized membrane protein